MNIRFLICPFLVWGACFSYGVNASEDASISDVVSSIYCLRPERIRKISLPQHISGGIDEDSISFQQRQSVAEYEGRWTCVGSFSFWSMSPMFDYRTPCHCRIARLWPSILLAFQLFVWIILIWMRSHSCFSRNKYFPSDWNCWWWS